MNEQGVEQSLRGGEGGRDLLRRSVSEAVRGSHHEASEGQPRVERGALKSSIAGPERHRQRRGLQHRGRRRHRHPLLARQLARPIVAEMRLPHPEFDALGRRPLRPRQSQHGLVVMRPEPVAEEARRHGEVDDLVIHLVKLHPSEPTGEDVFSQFRAEPALDFCPSIAWRALLLCHGSCSFPFVSFAPLRTARLILEQSTGSTRTAMTVLRRAILP